MRYPISDNQYPLPDNRYRKSMFFYHISEENKPFYSYNLRKSIFFTTFPKKILHISKKKCTFAPQILTVYYHVDWKTRGVNAFTNTTTI